MDGLFFLLSIVGITVVTRWCRNNDAVPPDGETRGLLAMGDPPSSRG